MPLTIMRRITFCAGHRLPGHGGKCENLHGHNYAAEIYVSGDKQDSVGRLIDFADIKRLLKGWIDDHWDHSVILWEGDRDAIAALEALTPSRLFLLPANPTAENMARYLLEVVCPKQLKGTGVWASRVVLWETPESCAEASL